MSEVKYFTPREVALHITVDDLWVSLFGKVLDLSPICKETEEDEDKIFALLAFAGKDISHLFDEHGEVKLHLDPNINETDAFLPFKRFIDVPSQEKAGELYTDRKKRDEKISEVLMLRYANQRLGMACDPSKLSISKWYKQPEMKFKTLPWWKDDKYVIGLLTKKPRNINVMNTMIMREVTIEVCSEETLEDIIERYLQFNRHVHSYTWKYFGQELNMKQTLEMNGIPDKDEEANRLRLNSEDFIPRLFIYFNHDLTEM